jgi:polar amino acid transport system ATP-binding protein
MSTLPLLELRDVGKSYGANRVLRGFNLSVQPGEIVSLIGPSGSGKTTALRCMNFLERYDEGEVWIDGQLLGYSGTGRREADRDSEAKIDEVRNPLSMVFQQFNLWPHMSVRENVMAPLVLGKKMPKAQARTLADQALSRVGLSAKGWESPGRWRSSHG